MTRLAPRQLHQKHHEEEPRQPEHQSRSSDDSSFSQSSSLPTQSQQQQQQSEIAMTEGKKKNQINLLRGWPSPSLLPAEAMRAASQRVLSDPAVFVAGLSYGPDPGFQPLREELGRWLGRFYFSPSSSSSFSRYCSFPPPSPTSSGGRNNRRRGRGGGGGSASGFPTEGDEAKESRDEAAEHITVTGGASQSVACILQSFTDPSYTRAVWMVAPCYFLACPIFADAGFAGRLRAVPEDEEGVDLDFLERGLERVAREHRDERREGEDAGAGAGAEAARYKSPGSDRKIYRHVVYCVPSFANPSGKTMTLGRREGLVRLARKHDALVICDDVYDMLQWPVLSASSSSQSSDQALENLPPPSTLQTTILPRLADIDLALGPSAFDPPDRHFGHVVSNGSFSKLVGPGVRTGWTYSTPDLAYGLSQTGSTRSGGAPSQLTATALWDLLGTGALQRHIEDVLKPAYQRRHALLLDAVRTNLGPLGVRVREGCLPSPPPPPSSSPSSANDERGKDVFGGYFLWMSFPPEVSLPSNNNNNKNTEHTIPDSTDPKPPRREGKLEFPPMKAVADRCRAEESLMIAHGNLFEVRGDEASVGFERGLRLCFAWEDEGDLVDGVERLGRVIRRMLEEGPSGWGAIDGREEKGTRDIDRMK